VLEGAMVDVVGGAVVGVVRGFDVDVVGGLAPVEDRPDDPPVDVDPDVADTPGREPRVRRADFV
jgi:hypothetical protein